MKARIGIFIMIAFLGFSTAQAEVIRQVDLAMNEPSQDQRDYPSRDYEQREEQQKEQKNPRDPAAAPTPAVTFTPFFETPWKTR